MCVCGNHGVKCGHCNVKTVDEVVSVADGVDV